MSSRLVPKIGDLECPWTAQWPYFFVISPISCTICRCKTIRPIRPTSVSKSTFDSLWPY